MSKRSKDKKKITFLFSDTGGGHRSASEAIIEALDLEYPGVFEYQLVDFFEDYSPPPLNLAAPAYPIMSRLEYLWELAFKISNDPDRMRVIYSTLWPYIRINLYRLLEDHPCDLFLSVHPLINIPLLRAMKKKGIHKPYIIVVTDLVSTHAAWYTNDADLVIIPTERAVQRALKANMKPEKLKIIGLPVANRFCVTSSDSVTLRKQLGWPEDKVITLLIGGGEGMGPLEEIAKKINTSCLDTTLVVVAGRNKKLKDKLENIDWNIPAFIYGFVKEMPDFMRAANILVTKAGPGTISEALIAGLQIILYHLIPGQEEGNVSYVIDEGAGIWAPETEDIIHILEDWINHPEKRNQAVMNARRLARPNASRDIAHVIYEYLFPSS